jgi:Mce-associated membrane protein
MAGHAAAPAQLTFAVEEGVDGAARDDDAVGAAQDESRSRSRRTAMSPLRAATVFGVMLLVALGALTSWLGFKAHQSYRADQQRALLLQVGRRGALNLTTIDWQHADSDVQRILSSATGAFHDDFANRSQPFIDVVKQAKSTSVGTVTEAALESDGGDVAQVLVAVSVKVTVGGAAQAPRAWRMRISVQKVGGDDKVSNVQFVP